MLHCDGLSSNEVMRLARLDKVYVMNVNYFLFCCVMVAYGESFTYIHNTQRLGIASNYSFCLFFVLKNN